MHHLKLIQAFSLFALLFGPLSAHAEENFLRPDEAFRLTGEIVDNDNMKVQWKIADGYYLYKSKISFRSNSPGIEVGGPRLPQGEIKKDEFFGDVEIYRGKVEIPLRLSRKDLHAESLTLIAKSQGCADAGLCFPPHVQTLSLHLPPSPQTTAPDISKPPTPAIFPPLATPSPSKKPSPFGGRSADEEILPVEEAFKFNATVESGERLRLHWQIAKGTYLYQEQIKIEVKKGDGVTLGEFALPQPKIKQNSIRPDGTEGDVAIYTEEIDLQLPLLRTNRSAIPITLSVAYQGCAEIGICYPPQRHTVELALPPVDPVAPRNPSSSLPLPQSQGLMSPQPIAEQDQIAHLLKGGDTWLIVLSFFGLGLLMAFTPCVFPMIPILSGIIAGHGTQLTPVKGFLLSLIYVLAMAATYTTAGVMAGLFGENLQVFFQNPWILGGFALLFVLLALSMFGFYDLELPKALQGRVSKVSNHQKSGTYTGVAVMGLLSALIVGPCVAPPLAGALIYIGQTGDALLGGLALFAMGLGMGAPLVVLGAGAGKLLPKAGIWMNAVKAIFGTLMLAVAILLLERIVPAPIVMLLWGLLLICSGVYMGALSGMPEHVSGWRKLWKGLGFAAVIYGTLMLIGVAANGSDSLQPLRGIVFGTSTNQAIENQAHFKRIKTVEELNRELASALSQNKPVMLDFYADWCTYCIQFEKYVFTNPQVRTTLAGFVLLQADVTANDDRDKALLTHFGIPAPPAIIFYGADGHERSDYRLMGYLKAEEFNRHVQSAIH